MSLDITAFRQALVDNHQQPEGPARNAAAEQLLAQAEQARHNGMVIEALCHLLEVYNYSSERDKMFVPFSRLLKMWDEAPEDFDSQDAHSLFWMFKWMSGGMINQDHVPLASIQKWQTEMEHRYRLAGHSERAVRQGELSIAMHIGDTKGGARAYAAWRAAERDNKSDCHACELDEQGEWEVYRGNDAAAIEVWQPVLDGQHRCAHEPHAVLASSLLPLLRLGRPEQARTNHLRGHRMVRPMESMRHAVSEHIEFCALSGNEARGLEILAERPAYFTDPGNPLGLMQYLAVTALLMRRLCALGRTTMAVPGPAGRSWSAAELATHAEEQALALAARFDERNGTQAVSVRIRRTITAEPLVDRLPLGVRATLQAVATPPLAEPAAPAQDFAAFLAEARRLSAAQHPDAAEAWDAAGQAAEREAVELAPREQAEIADHRAMLEATPPAETVELFLAAAELYEAAGDPGEAAACRARAAFALTFTDRPGEAITKIQEPCEQALALHAEGRASARQVTGALICRARILAKAVHEPDADEQAADRAESDINAFLAFAEPLRAEERMASRIGEALAHLADLASHREDAAAAAELYARSAAAYHHGQLPWFAVEPEAKLCFLATQQGDFETAERSGLAALEHGSLTLGPAGRARLHLQLAETYARTERLEQAPEHALEAAHWADEAGESESFGAWARFQLSGFLHRLERPAEAAPVLEAALADLSAETHGEGAVVQARWWLGDCLSALQEPRAAAEQYLLAAEIAKDWPEAVDHAQLAHLAADALNRAELRAEAVRAYERAGELWRELGNAAGLVRSLRSRAWLAVKDGGAGLEASRELMAAAAAESEGAELGGTHRQTAELIAQELGSEGFAEALSYAEQAIAAFAEAGAGEAACSAELLAAWFELDLDRTAEAVARARRVLAEPSVASLHPEAEELLGYAEA